MQIELNDNLVYGMTFSEGLSNFREENDKDIFEKIITINTIEEDENLSIEEKDKLIGILNSDMNPFEKRIRVMRALDKEKEFSSKIAIVLQKKLGKMDMVKEILVIFRDEYTKKDILKKDFGEVLTPLSTVKEMIEKVDDDFWKSPYDHDGEIKRILETSNGSGIFLWCVLYKFMFGLKEHFSDENERYKFIVENMLYACELQKSKMFNWLCTADLYDEYNLNVYCGSYLDDGFDNHMKEVWKIDKFSLCISNPPYQELSDTGKSKGGGKGGDNNLWSKFILKSITICEKLLFINPPSFLSPKHKVLTTMLELGGISYLHIYDKSPFDGVGTQACYYLWENDYKGETYTNSGVISLKNTFLPNSSNIIDFNIFGKFFSENNSKLGFTSNSKLHRTTKKDLISISEDEIFRYKVYHGSSIVWSSIKTEYYESGKVIISDSGYLNPKYDNNCSTTQHSFFLIEENNNMGNRIVEILKSKLYTYCLNKSKFSGFFHGEILKNIPIIPLDREWTDDTIFDYFNLNDEEKKTILNQ